MKQIEKLTLAQTEFIEDLPYKTVKEYIITINHMFATGSTEQAIADKLGFNLNELYYFESMYDEF